MKRWLSHFVFSLMAVFCLTAQAETLPLKSAGNIFIDPFQQYVGPALSREGNYYGVSDEDGTYLVDPATVAGICLFTNRVGGWMPRTSRACAPIRDGFATLPRTCNNDRGTYGMVLKEGGRILWFDFVSVRKWTFDPAGLPATVLTSGPNAGLIEYGEFGYLQAYIRGEEGGKMTINFGSSCMGGFSKGAKQPYLDPAKPLMYLWNSNSAGDGNVPGWGYQTDTPSDTVGWPELDDQGSWFVTVTGMNCNEAGNFTVYKGKGPPDGVVWQPGADGYGVGWLGIQPASDPNRYWEPRAGVSIDEATSQIIYTHSGCTPL